MSDLELTASRPRDRYSLTLVVTDGQVQMQRCEFGHRHPMVEKHHVCPASWWTAAGKKVDTPMATLCPNCHYGVHVCIDALIFGWNIDEMAANWYRMAARAIEIAARNGLKPAGTL